MFEFFKKNIYFISIFLIPLEVLSCFISGLEIHFLYTFFIVLIFSIFAFAFNNIIIHKRKVSDKDVFVLLISLVISVIFCIKSFLFIDKGATHVSIMFSVFFMTEFLLIRKFDLEIY